MRLKKIFIFSLVGSLIIAALVAVITVITGDFNEVTGRVLMTLLMVVTHSLISLLFIWSDEKKNTLENLTFSLDVLFILIVISFITSILGVWEIIGGETLGKLYEIYFVLFFSSLHVDILSKALRKEKYLDIIIYANYLFIIILALMFMPAIYYTDNGFPLLNEMFYRLMGAVAIIDGTLSILTIIFYRLYIHRHPDTIIQTNNQYQKGFSAWVWILIIVFVVKIILDLLFYVVDSNNNSNARIINTNRQNVASDSIVRNVGLQTPSDNKTPVCGPEYGTCAVGTASAITKKCDTGGCDWCELNNYYNAVYKTTGCPRITTNTNPTNCACMCEYYTCS